MSPLWCNLYFMAYEIQFVTRLVRLGLYGLLPRLEHTYQYIDDICALNNQEFTRFLDPDQPRVSDNPWWIYPLDLVEIKSEISESVPGYPD